MSSRPSLLVAALLALASPAAAGVDPYNPTCPDKPGWATYPQMRFTPKDVDGFHVLLAEGVVDDGAAARLDAVLKANKPFDEIWLSSPGGNAKIGNEAGRIIRKLGIETRVPAGAACFSACNFLFMGGPLRSVDEGGLFIVHMFTHTADRDSIAQTVQRGTTSAINLIGEIEQGSAVLATEDNDFLIRMGVSRKLLSDVMYKQKAIESQGADQSTRRCLTAAEMKLYNVTNL